jgi:hypothetical protein
MSEYAQKTSEEPIKAGDRVFWDVEDGYEGVVECVWKKSAFVEFVGKTPSIQCANFCCQHAEYGGTNDENPIQRTCSVLIDLKHLKKLTETEQRPGGFLTDAEFEKYVVPNLTEPGCVVAPPSKMRSEAEVREQLNLELLNLEKYPRREFPQMHNEVQEQVYTLRWVLGETE